MSLLSQLANRNPQENKSSNNVPGPVDRLVRERPFKNKQTKQLYEKFWPFTKVKWVISWTCLHTALSFSTKSAPGQLCSILTSHPLPHLQCPPSCYFEASSRHNISRGYLLVSPWGVNLFHLSGIWEWAGAQKKLYSLFEYLIIIYFFLAVKDTSFGIWIYQ